MGQLIKTKVNGIVYFSLYTGGHFKTTFGNESFDHFAKIGWFADRNATLAKTFWAQVNHAEKLEQT